MTRRLSRSAVDYASDPVRLARLLRRAHQMAMKMGSPPGVLRTVVESSWSRAAAAGVDPDGYAPTVLDDRETARALASNPASTHLAEMERLLREALKAGCFAVLSDPNGVLLWASGDPAALEGAAGPGFLPGHLCSEEALGTNAVGTAIALDAPVQIFAAEHFNRRLHRMTCAAAPIREPETGRLLGVLDVSGDFHTGHPHTLALVGAVAQVAEDRIEARSRSRDEELRAAYLDWVRGSDCEHSALVAGTGRVLAASPRGWLGPRLRLRRDGRLALPPDLEIEDRSVGEEAGAVIVRPRGGRRAARGPSATVLQVRVEARRVLVSVGEWETPLSQRHGEILVNLAIHPDGLSGLELGEMVYGERWKAVTLRAEVSRLRRLLGPVIGHDPYRLLVDVVADREALAEALPAFQARNVVQPRSGNDTELGRS
jgi:GAF domain